MILRSVPALDLAPPAPREPPVAAPAGFSPAQIRHLLELQSAVHAELQRIRAEIPSIARATERDDPAAFVEVLRDLAERISAIPSSPPVSPTYDPRQFAAELSAVIPVPVDHTEGFAELARRLDAVVFKLGAAHVTGTVAIDGEVKVSQLPEVVISSMPPSTVEFPPGLATDATLSALLAEFRNKYDVVSTAKATYTTNGDHNLITPSPGYALRPVWLYAQAKGALDTGTVAVTFTLGASSYEVELTGSQPFAHGAVWEGAADQALVVNTSTTAAVLVNVDYREFAP